MNIKEIKAGDILVNKDSGISYRVNYITLNQIVACKMNTTKLELYEFYITEIIESLKEEKIIVEKNKNIIFDVEKISKNMREKYETNLRIIQEIDRIFGPSYLKLATRSHKPEIHQICEKYNINRYKCSRLILRYLQSGMDEASLIDPRVLGMAEYKEYEYTKRPGRKSAQDVTSRVIITDEIRKQFDEAIIRYKKNRDQTIESSYEWLLQNYYTEYKVINGVISSSRLPETQRPTYWQYYTYLKKNVSKEENDAIKTSVREVRNNKRILEGDSLSNVYGPGDMVEIDAVEVDLSIVSELDRSKVVGRPIMYVMVDIFTRMILAISVSFDNNSMVALTNLFLNLSDDKIELCKKYGFEIEDNAWISGIIPRHVRVDRGADFRSDRFASILRELGIDRQLVSAASGSLKGTVEQEFRSLHYAIKPHMSENGVISQRYDSEHHKNASITIGDFTRMAIAFVLNHNQNASSTYPLTPDMIRNGVHANPQELWEYGCKKYGAPRPITNIDQYYYSLLTPVNARISRQGIKALGLFYTTTDLKIRNQMYNSGRKSVTIEMRYDPRDISRLYFISDEQKLAQAPLNINKTGMQGYIGMTEYELKMYKKRESELRLEDKKRNRENKADLYTTEELISKEALSSKEEKTDSANLREHRNTEKQNVQYQNRVATRTDDIESKEDKKDNEKALLTDKEKDETAGIIEDISFDEVFDKYF